MQTPPQKASKTPTLPSTSQTSPNPSVPRTQNEADKLLSPHYDFNAATSQPTANSPKSFWTNASEDTVVLYYPDSPSHYPPRIGDYEAWDKNYPESWPCAFLPFHVTQGSSQPTSTKDMIAYVEYQGMGAQWLKWLLAAEINSKDTDEDMREIEVSAFLSWPYNIASDGYWKGKPRLSKEELVLWRQLRMEKIAEEQNKEEHVILDDTILADEVGVEETNWGSADHRQRAWSI